MAIAGSVAPVFRDGGYDATATYDFYHALIHNNKLYFCRQDGTIGHEPQEESDEYWFLSIDGNFADAVTLNGKSESELSVANSENLGGKGAREYALGTDLEDYGLTNKFSGTWKRGLYNTNGTWDTSSTNNWITADDILVNSGNVLNAKISLIVTYVRVIYFNGSTYDSQILFTNTNTIKNLVIPSNITKIAICLGDSKGMSDATHLGVYINNAIDEVKADLANYLPLTGGKLTASGVPLILEATATYRPLLQFVGTDGACGYFGYHGADKPCVLMSDNKTLHYLHHDGNSAKVVQATSAPSDTTAVWVDTANKVIKIYKDGAWTALA